jgi:hypothetical protein
MFFWGCRTPAGFRLMCHRLYLSSIGDLRSPTRGSAKALMTNAAQPLSMPTTFLQEHLFHEVHPTGFYTH